MCDTFVCVSTTHKNCDLQSNMEVMVNFVMPDVNNTNMIEPGHYGSTLIHPRLNPISESLNQ